MHGVYVLGSQMDGTLYVGSSHDIKARLAEHNAGRVPATKLRKPFELLYCEVHASRSDAMQRELYLKTGWGKNYLERTIPIALKTFRSKFGRV